MRWCHFSTHLLNYHGPRWNGRNLQFLVFHMWPHSFSRGNCQWRQQSQSKPDLGTKSIYVRSQMTKCKLCSETLKSTKNMDVYCRWQCGSLYMLMRPNVVYRCYYLYISPIVIFFHWWIMEWIIFLHCKIHIQLFHNTELIQQQVAFVCMNTTSFSHTLYDLLYWIKAQFRCRYFYYYCIKTLF